eukprot:gnl/Chilomastix_cuspidata/1200.p1 GENE.gnl/Chilomastix_cuspidata/1200~~gnl/Chilomastix_cuspidata/1200.p1  ORF type:complete len:202 (+),score=43.77 gnl/Chilomastix_cuspidata/1200:495-1100(+)
MSPALSNRQRQTLTKHGRFMSYILRHKPEEIGISIDKFGWVLIEDFIRLANEKRGKTYTRTLIDEVVATDSKGRFEVSPDNLRIRACQGHSISIDLELKPIDPPDAMFHGTAHRNVASILEAGLQNMSRQYVHLSPDVRTAVQVGSRHEKHGFPAILRVDGAAIRAARLPVFRSTNGVWLMSKVPSRFIHALTEEEARRLM